MVRIRQEFHSSRLGLYVPGAGGRHECRSAECSHEADGQGSGASLASAAAVVDHHRGTDAWSQGNLAAEGAAHTACFRTRGCSCSSRSQPSTKKTALAIAADAEAPAGAAAAD